MGIDTNKFVGGYSEKDVNKGKEQALDLHYAVERLMNNEDFLKVYNHYTNQTVLEEAEKAGVAAEYRPVLFESILNRVAFKQYIQELLDLDPKDLVEDGIESIGE